MPGTVFKVIFNGTDIVSNDRLRVVKSGNFTVDDVGAAQALEYGMLDKYGHDSDVPQFLSLAMLPKPAKREDTLAFSAVIKKLAHNGRDLLGIYLVDVQFRAIKHNV